MITTAAFRVPATSANLGPGFDSLGVALRLGNTVTVSRRGEPMSSPMVSAAAKAFFERSSVYPFPFGCSVGGDVPRSRGLGSSVTVRLGVLHGLNALAGNPLDAVDLFRLCAELEGHPDNAAPAAFGGFTVCRPDGAYQRFAVSARLRFILLIPAFEVETEAARRVLPEAVPLAQAAASAAGAASIAAAFASRDYAALRGAFRDYLHEPYRERLVPGMRAAIDAGIAAGALGGWLSGSGSTLACVAFDEARRVAAAMSAAFGGDAETLVVTADNRGVRRTTA